MSIRRLGPCTLDGRFVRLEPLRKKHASGLFEASQDLDWTLMLRPLHTREAVDERIVQGLAAEKRDEEYAFAVILKKEERIVGSTAYLTISSRHRRGEIGATWYSPSLWGTAVNPECKFLLLRHAFEDWDAVRIQLGTDEKNFHSQNAILKLGAKFEGTLRNHGIRPDGTTRNSMLYSIISSEWPVVKSALVARIEMFGSGKE